VYERSEGVLDGLGSRLLRDRGRGEDDANAVDLPACCASAVRPNPDIALRSGPAPEILTASTAEGELQVAVDKILAWREEEFKPSEIAVLYRANTEGWVTHLALIARQRAVYWPHDPSGDFFNPSGVCVRTMFAAKRLQWRAVLVRARSPAE